MNINAISFLHNIKMPNFKRSFVVGLLVFLGVVITSQSVFGQTTYYSRGNGNWDGAVWSTSTTGSPATANITASDYVVIQTGNAITVNVTNAVCSTLDLGTANGTATLNFSNTGNPMLTVSTTVTIGNIGNKNRTGVIALSNGSTLICGSLSIGAIAAQGSSVNMTLGGTLKIGGSMTVFSGSTFTPGVGTVEYSGTAQTIYAAAYNNLALSGSGAKTIATGTSVTRLLSITGTAKASINPGLNISVDSLSIVGNGTVNGTWGSTTATNATYKTNTYFAATTGYITVSTNTAATPTVTPTVGSYTYNGSAQGPNSATNTGSGSSYTFSYSGTGGTTYGPSATAPTNAGSYTVTVTLVASTDGFYNAASSAATTFTIAQKALTIGAASVASKTYDGLTTTGTLTLGSLSGLVSTQTLTVSASGTFADASVASGKIATIIYTLGNGTNGGLAANYSLANGTATGNITAASLNITANNDTKTYGQIKTYGSGSTAFTSSGLQNSETISSVTITASGGEIATSSVGNYTLTPSVATGGTFAASNYSITYNTGTLTVNTAALTITGISISNKIYDGNTTATITGTAAYSGLVNSESFNVTGTPTASFADANVGTSKTVTIIGYAAPSLNYSITQPSGLSADITAKALTISGATTTNKVYDGTNVALVTGGSLVGVVSPDVVTLTQSGTFATKNVGTGIAITSTCSIAGADASNYTLTQPSLTSRDITAKGLTISGATTANKVYDGTNVVSVTGGFLVGVMSTDVVTLAQSGTFATKNVGTGIAITSTCSIAGADASNYTITQPSLTSRDITAKALTISGATTSNKVYDGTNVALVTGGSLVGIVSPDVVTLTQTGTFATKNVGTVIAITSTCSIAGADASNYTLTQPLLISRDITAKAITISGATTSNKVYDGANFASVTGGSLVGVVSPDVVTLTQSAIFATKNVGTGIAITSTCSISGADASNYTLTQPLLTSRDITAKALTISGATTSNKVYDGTNVASVTGGSLVGVVSLDVVTLTQSGTFATSNVGTGIAITSTCSISGADASNYTLTQPSLTSRDITAKALTISGATTSNKVYDGTNLALVTGGSLVGVVSPDVVTLTQSGTFATSNVSTGIVITSTCSIAGSNASNYTLTRPLLTSRDITAKALTITGVIANNKLYDGTTLATLSGTPAYSGLVNGETYTVTGTPIATFASANVGTGITVTVTGYTAPSSNYSISQPVLSANITIANSSITSTGTTSYTYTGLAQGPASATVTGSTGVVTYTYSGTGSTTYTASATKPTNAGTYQVVATVAADANHNSASSSPLAFTIGQASLTITARDTSRVYGTILTGGSGSTRFISSGLQNGETIGSVTLAYASNGNTATDVVGVYSSAVIASAATGGTFTASNYSITYVNGSITVTKKSLTITANNQTVSYSTTVATVTGAGSYTASGFVNGETSSVITGTATYTTTYTATTAAGTAGVTITPVVTGLSATNYSFTTANGTITIGKVNSTITATGTTSYTYTGLAQGPATATVNGSTGAITYSYSGTGGTTYTASATKPTNAGTYQVIATVAADVNYNSALSSPLAFTINKTSLSITANIANKTYGTAQSTPVVGSTAFTSAGLVNGETIGTVTLAYGTGAILTTDIAGSTSVITPSAATGGTFNSNNYNVTYNTGTLTVTTKSLTITGATASNKVYDATTATIITGTLSGVVNGDVITLVGTGTFANANVGTAKAVTASCTLSGTNAASYTLTQPTGLTANITPRPIQLSGTRVYDGTRAATASILSITNNLDGANLTLSGTGYASLEDVGTRSISNSVSITLVQTAVGSTGANAATSFSVNLGTAPIDGNTLIALVATRNSNPNTVTSITQTGATWTRAAQSNNSGGTSVEIWYAQARSVSGATINITLNQANVFSTASIIEYAGIMPLNPFDVSNTANGNNSSVTTGSITPTQSNELMLAAIGVDASNLTFSSIIGSFTSFVSPASTNGTASNNAKLFALERIINTSGTYSTGGALSANSKWSSVIAGFKSAIPNGGGFVLSGSAASNYTVTGLTGTLVITEKALTITAPVISPKTYDGTVTTGTITPGNLTGLISPETLVVTATGTYSNANVGTSKTASVIYSLSDGTNGGQAINYTLSNGTGTGNITAAPLTIAGVTANNKVYDGTTAATLSGTAAYSGLVNGETFSVTGTPTAAFASANVGTGITVTVTGYTAPSSNYSITQPVLSADITSASSSITATGRTTYTYNATAQGPSTYTKTGSTGVVSYSYSGTGSTVYGPTATKPTNAGTYQVIATLAADANYSSATSSPLAFTINQASLTITARDTSRVYGTTLTGGAGSTRFTSSGLLGGQAIGSVTLSYASNGNSVANPVGVYTNAVIASAATGGTFNPNNYNITYVNGSITVTKKVLTITANNQSVSYGTAIATVTGNGSYTATGFVNGDNSSVISGTVTYNTTYTATTNAGTAGVTITPVISGLSATNYSFVAATGTITIVKATPVVTVTGIATYTYSGAAQGPSTATTGGSIGTVTYSYSGTGSTVYAASATRPTNVGTYQVIAKVAATTNYDSAFSAPYAFVINPKPLSITPPTIASKVYNGSAVTGAVTVGTLSLLVGTQTLVVTATGLYADPNVGTGKSATIIYVLANGANGGLASNYSLANGTATGNITPAPLTIKAGNISKPYGTIQVNPVLGSSLFTATGLVNAETVGSVTLNFNPLGALNDTARVGSTSTITPSASTGGTFLASNYNITYTTGLLTVTALPLTITATGPAKTYGTTLNTLTNSTSNFVVSGSLAQGEAIVGVTLAPNAAGATATTAAGSSYTVTPSNATGLGGFVASNYSITYVPYTGTVTKRTLGISGTTIASKVYNGLPICGAITPGTLSNLYSTETLVVTASGAYTDANAGTGKTAGITYTLANGLNGGLASNYTLANGTGTGNITAAPLTISVIANNKQYDKNRTATLGTATYQGLQNGEIFTVSGTPVANFNDSAVGNAKPVTVSGYLAPSSNYSVAQPTGLTANITKKIINIIGLIANNKVYDGNTNATLSGAASLSGVISSENVTLSGIAVASFLTPTVGVAKQVNVTGFKLAGTRDTNNYSINQPLILTADIVAGTPVRLVIDSIVTQTAGTPFSVVVRSTDAYGNPSVVNSNVGVQLNVISGTDSLNGTLFGTIISGTSSTVLLGLNYYTAEDSIKLSAYKTSGTLSLIPDSSNYFTVNPNQLSSFEFEEAAGGEIGPQTVNVAFPIKITAVDSYGNTINTFNSSVTITTTGTITSGGGVTSNFVSGVLASRNITISSIGKFTLTAIRTSGTESGTSNLFAVGRVCYSRTSGNYNSNIWSTTTTGSIVSGLRPTAADVAVIQNGNTITVTANDSCRSVLFNGASATLNVNTNVSLIVNDDIKLNNSSSASFTANIGGLGTISCDSISVGGTSRPSSLQTTTFNSSVSNLVVSKNLTLRGLERRGNRNNPSFKLATGSLSIGGNINSVGQGGSISTFTMDTLQKNATLNWSSLSPSFSLTSRNNSGTTIFNVNVNSLSTTVNYNGSSNQIIPVTYPSSKIKTASPINSTLQYRNLTVSNAGIKRLSKAVIINGELKVDSSATFQLDSLNRFNTSATPLVLNGGSFSTGATTGYGDTLGTLKLTGNASIDLASGKHKLLFSVSNKIAWTAGKVLTINGWTGNRGDTGTAGRIFIGKSDTTLTGYQLSQIRFAYQSTIVGAALLPSGELVPIPLANKRYSRQSGNWSDPNTWTKVSGSIYSTTIPVAGDTVIIERGHSVTVDISNAECASVDLGSTATTTSSGSLTFASTGSPALTMSGRLLIGASGNAGRTGSVVFTNGSTLNTKNITIGGISTTPALGTINMANGGMLRTTGFTIGAGGTWTPGLGTVELTATNTLPATLVTSFNNLIVGAGITTLGANLSAVTANVNSLTIKDSASLNLASFSYTTQDSLVMYCGTRNGTSITGAGVLTLGGNIAIKNNATGNNNAVISCPLALGSNRIFNIENDGTDSTDLLISNVISGASSVTKNGLGKMHLSGLNTYTGATIINAGVLSTSTIANGGVASSLGQSTNAAANLIIGNATLQYNGATTSTDRSFTLATGANAVIDIADNTLIISGASAATTGNLIKRGSGTLILNAYNAYTGTTTVSQGALIAGVNAPSGTIGALGNSASSVVLGDSYTNNESPSLYSINSSTIARAILIDSFITTGAYQLGVKDAATSLFTGAITMKQPLTVSAVASGSVIFSNTITANGFKLSKVDLGTMKKSTLPLTLSGEFEINSGDFDANGMDVSVAGLVTINGGNYRSGSGLNNLTGGIKQVSGSFVGSAGRVVSSTVNILGGSFTSSATTLELTGNFNNNGTFLNNNGEVLFDGVSSQNITGSSLTSFSNLTLNNSNGLILADTSDVTIAGTLELDNGKVYTNANDLILLSTANVLGASSTGYVSGNLKKYIPQSSASIDFEIGDDVNYAPVRLDFVGTISASTGSVRASTKNNDHPQLSSSSFIANRTVNRYWSLNNDQSIPGLASYNATFNFVSTDLDAGIVASNCIIGKYNNGWRVGTRGTVTQLSVEHLALTGFGDFQIGEGTNAPEVSLEPLNTTVCAGDTAYFITESNTLPVPSVVWQRLKSGATVWENLVSNNQDNGVVYSGYNTTTLTLANTSSTVSGYKYRAIFTNADGTVTSSDATLTINTAPFISSQPVSPAKICSGNGIQTVSVVAGGGSLNYLWRKNGNSIVNDNVVSGQGTPTLVFTNTTNAYIGNYDVLIYSNCFPSVSSNIIKVELNADVVPSVYATSSDFDRKICSGETVTFTAHPTNGGTTPQYQWKRNGIAIPGATNAIFTTNSLNNNDAITVQMTSSLITCSSGATVQSNVLFFTVNKSPSFVRNYASGCINGVVPIYLVTDTLPATVNPWISLDTTIAAVENSFPNASVTGRDTGVTYIIYTDINSCSDTLIYRVTSPLNAPDTIYGPQVLCGYYNTTGFTDTIYYNVNPVQGADSYDWIMPRGAQIVSGWGTTNIGIVVDTSIISRYGQGIIYMAALTESGCASPYVSLRLYRSNPPVGPISGPSQICNYIDNNSSVRYHIDTIAGVRSYTWVVPNGASIDSGQGTNDIYVRFTNSVRNFSIVQVTLSFNCAAIVKKSTQLYWSNPPTPSAIYGADSVCNVGDGSVYAYYTDSIPGITQYEWVVPSTMVIVSGQGTRMINVRFNSNYLSSSIKVRAVTNCGASYYKVFYVGTVKYSKPGLISGPSNTCVYMNTGTPAVYKIKKVTDAPYYLWEFPLVGTDSVIHPEGFGPNDTTIIVYYNANLDLSAEDSIQVRSGGCNYSVPSTLLLKGAIPVTPISIVGPSNACSYMVSSVTPNGILATYTIPKVRDALSYIWSVSGNVTIIDHPAGYGENDTIVRIKYYSNFTNGTIYVNAANSCGFSAPRSKSVVIYNAGILSSITANETATCPQRIIEYSVASMPTYADSIIWTVPSVATILSGQGTTMITVSYPSSVNLSSMVTARAVNNCSVGYTRTLKVSLTAVACAAPPPTAKDLPITNNSNQAQRQNEIDVAVYPNPSNAFFNVKVESKENEKVNVQIFDVQGREIKRLQINAGELNKIGAEFKSGIYYLKVNQKGMSKTQKIIKL